MPPPKRSSFPAHRIKCAGFQIGMGGGGKPPALRKTSSFTGNKLVGTHISYLLSKTKNRPKNEAVLCRRVYKPGSVLTAIYLAPQLLTGSSRLLGTVGQTHCPSTALLRDRVYIVKPMLPWAGCALTAPFHPYLVDSPMETLPFPQAEKVTLHGESPLSHRTRLRWASMGALFGRGGISLLHLS